jgi:hypothetical protein
MVQQIVALGISEIGLYYPMLESQHAAFTRIARDVLPTLRAEWLSRQQGTE